MNMDPTTYITVALILLGAFIMLMSARYTKKIFNILDHDKLKNNWKKLRLLMLVFFAAYLIVTISVILGKTDLLILLSGLIFFMGSLFVFIVVSTGLDSFKKLQELNQNLDDTVIKNKELEQFAYITSHDLKAPLRGISSLATFVKEDIESGNIEDVPEHIDMMQGRIEYLENLINGILNYSKIGKVTIESVDLNLLIQEEFQNYQNLNHVNLTVKNKLPIVNGDKVQLSQIAANLIGNSIKYNNKDTCLINVSCNEHADYYELCFEDNGPGIPKQYHKKIFEIFQTLQEDDTPESTGIGLSIVKKAIEKHNGTIKIESDGKLGTKFIITYPKNL